MDQLSKKCKVTKFNQKTQLKQYTDINTELRKHSKNEFEKAFF